MTRRRLGHLAAHAGGSLRTLPWLPVPTLALIALLLAISVLMGATGLVSWAALWHPQAAHAATPPALAVVTTLSVLGSVACWSLSVHATLLSRSSHPDAELLRAHPGAVARAAARDLPRTLAVVGVWAAMCVAGALVFWIGTYVIAVGGGLCLACALGERAKPTLAWKASLLALRAGGLSVAVWTLAVDAALLAAALALDTLIAAHLGPFVEVAVVVPLASQVWQWAMTLLLVTLRGDALADNAA